MARPAKPELGKESEKANSTKREREYLEPTGERALADRLKFVTEGGSTHHSAPLAALSAPAPERPNSDTFVDDPDVPPLV